MSWNEGMAPIGHTPALPARMSLRFKVSQPRGMVKSWFIWDTKKKNWVTNAHGSFRRFGTQKAASQAAKKLIRGDA